MKIEIKNKYSVIPNEVVNSDKISLSAKGMYAYLQGKPDGWRFSVDRIKTHLKEKKGAVASSLQELEDAGLLTRKRTQDKKGHWQVDYTLTAFPSDGFPNAGNPNTGFPDVGFPDVGNPNAGIPDAGKHDNNNKKEYSKKDNNNKEYSNKDYSKENEGNLVQNTDEPRNKPIDKNRDINRWKELVDYYYNSLLPSTPYARRYLKGTKETAIQLIEVKGMKEVKVLIDIMAWKSDRKFLSSFLKFAERYDSHLLEIGGRVGQNLTNERGYYISKYPGIDLSRYTVADTPIDHPAYAQCKWSVYDTKPDPRYVEEIKRQRELDNEAI